MGYLIYVILFIYFHQALSLENRVFGGRVVPDGSQKHLVSLELNYQMLASFCSGSIISPFSIITSAHCFDPTQALKVIYIIHQNHGEIKLMVKVKAKAFKIIIHPDWIDDECHRHADLALIKTRKKIYCDDLIIPIQLARMEPQVGQSAIIAGFGLNDIENAMGKATEGMVKLAKCDDDPADTKLICSDDIGRAGPGDSGGSLALKGILIGVTSASCTTYLLDKKCKTVYANVANSYKWISKNMI